MRKYRRRQREGTLTPKPNPVDVSLLKQYVELWSLQLLTLRDGRPGKIVLLQPGETKPTVVAEVIPQDRRAQSALPTLKKLRGKEGTLWVQSPIFSEPKIWHDLKTAKSTHEIRDAVISLERYLRRRWQPPDEIFSPRPTWTGKKWSLLNRRPTWHETGWSKSPESVKNRANELLKSKRSRCPKKDRPTSDNKRIEFFAKVLSGLALGRTPTYTLKILAGWTPPSILQEKSNAGKEPLKGERI